MKTIPLLFLIALTLSSCSKKEDTPDFKIEFGEVVGHSMFVSDDLSIWFGSLVKGEDRL